MSLYVDSVVKSFGTKQILSDIFLECKKGDVIGLFGRNGVGKSTLLKIIFGVLPCESKFIRLDGQLCNGVGDHKGAIAYLPQDGFMPRGLKVKTALSLLCENMGLMKLLSTKAFGHLLNQRVSELSGGELRMLEVMALIYSRANYVLLDEPFNGISPLQKETVMKLIVEQSKFKGFIITDHDFRSVLAVATKRVLIHDGGSRSITKTSELSEWGYLP